MHHSRRECFSGTHFSDTHPTTYPPTHTPIYSPTHTHTHTHTQTSSLGNFRILILTSRRNHVKLWTSLPASAIMRYQNLSIYYKRFYKNLAELVAKFISMTHELKFFIESNSKILEWLLVASSKLDWCVKFHVIQSQLQFVGNKVKERISKRISRFIRQQSTPNFPKNKLFLPPDTHTHLSVSRGKKCSFFGRFGVFFSFSKRSEIFHFALLPTSSAM